MEMPFQLKSDKTQSEASETVLFTLIQQESIILKSFNRRNDLFRFSLDRFACNWWALKLHNLVKWALNESVLIGIDNQFISYEMVAPRHHGCSASDFTKTFICLWDNKSPEGRNLTAGEAWRDKNDSRLLCSAFPAYANIGCSSF